MTNSESFLESIINIDHRVYGFKLRPFSLFHAAYLEFLENPLITGGDITPDNLFQAAVVCSCESPAEISKRLKSKLNPLKVLWFTFEKELGKFNSYFADFFSLPDCYPSKDKDGKASIPYILAAVSAIIKTTGWRFDDVFFKMPIGQVIWLNLAFGFLESGKTNLISDNEKGILSHIENLKAEGII